MRARLLALTAPIAMAAAIAPASLLAQDAPKPATIAVDGAPPVPMAVVDATRPYMEYRTAAFLDWNPTTRGMLISTRFASVPQLHTVAGPGMARQQISFEAEPLAGWYAPNDGTLVVRKDKGGDEFFQLYTLKNGRLTLLTDGKSRNEFQAFSHDGQWIAYSSTRRNGVDSDLYVVNPRNPATNRLVAQVKGGGWSVAGFSPDGKGAVVREYISIQKSNLWWLDIASGKLTPIGDHAKPISYAAADFAADGTLWVTSDEGSDYQRLGTLDPRTGKFSPRAPDAKGDVEEFSIADDGSFIAYAVNETGISKLRLLDPKTGTVRDVTALPAGVISTLKVAPWGTVGLTLSSAKVPADAFAVDPKTLAATRWTTSETGGLDPAANVDPELVQVKSFDGETVTGFLYRPDPAKFPGKRPLIVNIHGGPEGQTTPGFKGRVNYLINELGIAVFYPNVRGSSGFGKRFVGLDNGPFRREDSVKDIGPLLDRLQSDPAIDPARMAVTGGSYGGYMCYASAIRYGDRLKAADCIVAISNFVTFLENTQGYRRDLRRAEYGDERDPKQRAQLTAISPLTSVDRLTIPLMVVTGANDPRVPKSEADQMVAAVRAKGRPAWHIVGLNEGHGFAKKENADYQFWTEIGFWKANLLGEK
ncbi:prolyl oligopeptidase family serine peptidase [Novosphingobium sp. EMRT-2]|uniref:S9 family peptidase n=1 Tax=Novosphingobium sp. EMRT-2 TaxID=2571749 RepID=UPI0010BE1A0C|nr:prolyl oligopeptidase family serine peptidase [Novosphingobium sp. EMRT-2]QCI95138.1 S9 family peptidase [Novosphingobium sp. EMRT-2]